MLLDSRGNGVGYLRPKAGYIISWDGTETAAGVNIDERRTMMISQSGVCALFLSLDPKKFQCCLRGQFDASSRSVQAS